MSSPELDSLGRASRRAGALTLGGGVLVLAILVFSAWETTQLQQEVASLVHRREKLRAEISTLEATQRGIIAAQQDKSELAIAAIHQNDAKGAVDILSAPVAAQGAAAVEQARVSVPRVYFQSPRDFLPTYEPVYEKCAAMLRGRGYRVPGNEIVAKAPRQNEVRYFHPEDQGKAQELADLLTGCVGSPVATKSIGAYEGVNPLHFEVWFAQRAPQQ